MILQFHLFFLSEPPVLINLWIGSSDIKQGATSGIHHDYEDNLYVLIQGTKKLRLYSPKDSFNLYPTGDIIDITPHGRHSYCYQNNAHWSLITGFDLPQMTTQEIAASETLKQKFPRFAHAKSVECTLSEGEMLYIPNGWWHQVTSYGLTIALNIWTDSAV
eukprot:TRINITY_DN8966_c0_g1_i1.p1 TRINITY_DN8966_c0_g1~~TRINITY_DN8966_c0_g1_i1.p1  ORF type:complete len:161 (-),score=26.00 TRINITY_DN8966_c0_g1_i1:86-568(-)